MLKIHYISSPNKSPRPGGKNDIDTIVLHHTATGTGTTKGVIKWFQNPASQVSAHYVISKSGTIYQMVLDSEKAWHAGTSMFKGRSNVNDFSIGIEMINKGDNKDPYPDAQVRAVAQLCKRLMTKHPKIKIDRITDHKAINSGKIDLRKNFPLSRFKFMVAHPSTEVPPVPENAPAWLTTLLRWLRVWGYYPKGAK